MISIVGVDFIELYRNEIEEISRDCNDPNLYKFIFNGVKDKRMFAFHGGGGIFVLMPSTPEAERCFPVSVWAFPNCD